MNFHRDVFKNGGTVLKTKFIDMIHFEIHVLCFILCQVKPLIWIESVIERHSHSRVEYMIKVGGMS